MLHRMIRIVHRRRQATAAVLCCGLALVTAGCASMTGASPVGRGPRNHTRTATTSQATAVYTFGRLGGPGRRTQIAHATPTRVKGIMGTVVQIATTNSDSYALTSTGRVWAWGTGIDGQLGDGGTALTARRAVEVHFPAGVRIALLPNPMPYDAALAVDSHGDVWGWGENGARQLCLSHRAPFLVPHRLPFSGVTLATGAGGHSLFESGGKLFACGQDAAGELGNGTTTRTAGPTAVVGLPGGQVKALVSSWQGSGALMSDGSYFDWGYNATGQLGDGTTTNSDVPVKVSLPDPVVQVSQGGSLADNGQTLVILADNSVWAWGNNTWGQLGTGSKADSPVPVAVHVPSGVKFAQVSSGGSWAYAIDSRGQTWAWGRNMSGQLGVGSAVITDSVPTPIGVTLTQVSSTANNVAGFSRSKS
jgi:alpha-tubulin suppressor-like RCC1 family protein